MRRNLNLLMPVLLFIAGAATVLAFAPVAFWPIQIFSMAFLAWAVWRSNDKRHAFFWGLSHGVGALGTGVYWLYVSLHDYGGMPVAMASFAVVMMGLTLGLHTAISCLGFKWLCQRFQLNAVAAMLLVFPAMWLFLEWIRGWILTGLPWIVSGYAHTDSPYGGYAPIVGVYGVGLISALIAGALALIICVDTSKRKRYCLICLCLIGSVTLVGALLRTVNWTQPTGKPISVRLLQANVAQQLKFSPEQMRQTLIDYTQMITAKPADLIATPETALPLPPHMLPSHYLPYLADYGKRTHSNIAVGLPIVDGPVIYTNSMIVMPSKNEHSSLVADYRYDKHHLVPFGEFIPFGFRWFVAMMHMPLGDFTRGNALQGPFTVGEQMVMPDICYEDLFGEEIAAQIQNESQAGRTPPTILLNMTNIAWFGPTIALPQHLQIARMRAMETARPMLRATNTGTTAVIDAHGQVIERLPVYTVGEIYTNVQGMQGITPYIRFGNLIALIIGLCMLIGAFFVRGKHVN